ncbi:MAG TPA: hypothetical protein VMN60_13225 [Longimicrobiales bacterium]|nr:hypothetical protein [Longimicrobiales bacterium]
MNLIGFHRVLIGTAILFFVGYGAWELASFLRDRDTASLLLGLGSLAAAVLLFLYLRRLRQFLNLPDER